MHLNIQESQTAAAHGNTPGILCSSKGKKLLLGTLMFFSWLTFRLAGVVPLFIIRALERCIQSGGTFQLVQVTLELVLANSLLAILLFNGVFLFAEGIREAGGHKKTALALPLFIIPLCYIARGNLLQPSELHFGVPALLTLFSVALLQFLCQNVSRGFFKLAVQSTLIFSVQWLDVIPSLTQWGFGGGELSLTVKQLAILTDNEHLLNMLGGTWFCFTFCAAMLVEIFFLSYEKSLYRQQLLRKKEEELRLMRQDQARSRFYQEVQYLVHDLKRPLTAILGLADLLSLSRDPSVARHGLTITRSAEQMNQMISEIRTPEKQRCITVKELLDYTMAQIRPLEWGHFVIISCDERTSQRFIKVNLVQFSRAIANLLDNAFHATQWAGKTPSIILAAAAGNGEIRISVDDNGPGFFPNDEGKNNSGVSSLWGSTGLGIPFVKTVAQANHAGFTVENRKNGGAHCLLTLREDTTHEKL